MLLATSMCYSGLYMSGALYFCALEAIAGHIGAIAEMQTIFCIFVVFSYGSRDNWCCMGQTLCTTVVHWELPCCYMCLEVVPIFVCCAVTEMSCKSKTYAGFIQWHRNWSSVSSMNWGPQCTSFTIMLKKNQNSWWLFAPDPIGNTIYDP